MPPKNKPEPSVCRDLLALWRRQSPADVSDDEVKQLSEAILTRAQRPKPDEKLKGLILRAKAHDPDAWLALADRIPAKSVLDRSGDEQASDIEGSCLWLAARDGLPWAHLMLMHRIARLDSAPELAVHRLNLLRSCAQAADFSLVAPAHAVRSLGFTVDVLGCAPSRGRQETLEPIDPDRSTKLDASCPSLGVRILRTRPPEGSRDDRTVIERYSELMREVPLSPLRDPDVIARQLLAEFPWFSNVIHQIRADLLLAKSLGTLHFRLPPILIVGPSGIGKTRLTRRLAEIADLSIGQVSCAGSSDNRALSGTARGWSTATPCLPLTVMLRYRTANPMIVVDDIDKAGGSDRNGRIADTLLAMVDPSTAREFLDECLLVPADLSWVSWVLVANRLDRVPPLLRGRCRILRAERPRPQDFDIVLRGILRDLAAEFQTEAAAFPALPPEVIAGMRNAFKSRRIQARQLAAMVRRALALAAEAECRLPRH